MTRIRGAAPKGRLKVAAGALALALLLAGCSSKTTKDESSPVQSLERGPYKLSVMLKPAEIWIGDSLQIELTVRSPGDAVVRFVPPDFKPPPEETATPNTAVPTPTGQPSPAPGSAPAQHREPIFALRGAAGDPPKLETDGTLTWHQTYTVEPLASGTLDLPPLHVEYGKKPEKGEPDFDAELVTEPTKVAIRSVLTTQDAVQRPRDITGALLLPARPLTPLEWSLLIGAIAGVIAGAYAGVVAIRRRLNRPKPPVPAEIWALQALEELSPAKWFAERRVREFYYRLSEVLRAYIERKFGLHAPEMTTEEFLGMLARDSSALPYDAYRLRQFLEACDLVKYAALEPQVGDAEQAVSTARAFVHTTAAAVETQRAAEAVSGGQAA